MSLAIGSRLGVYQVLALIGQGGMGEVYLARDTQLKREVALKVLPDQLASDPAGLARFRREAEILASLNHPNLAAVYGIADGALVMELVNGQTLQERIRSGPLPINESLSIARQIIAAIEFAHDHGVVHRDLKPANIKITPDGQVKVLDFGLAKALDDRPALAHSPDESPTLTLGGTQMGVVLGTAAYMSPEQASGKTVDRRSDIFSFGVILFEMLTRTRAFAGDSIMEILAAVVRDPPNWAALPSSVPPHVRRLLERCLCKDKSLRLQSIGEARIALDEPEIIVPVGAPHRPVLQWVLATLAITAAAMLGLLFYLLRSPASKLSLYASLPPPLETNYAFQGASLPAVSPDGRQLIVRAATGDVGAPQSQLFLRTLDSPTAQPIPGTEGASGAIWSPDGRSIAFVVDNQLKRLDLGARGLNNAPAFKLAELPGTLRGGAWSPQGILLLGLNSMTSLLRVPANGGTPTPVAKVTGEEVSLRFPQFLPDGEHFLYQATLGGPNGESHLRVGSLSGGPQPGTLVGTVYSNAISSAGHLLSLRDDTLVAQPFDEKTFQLSGAPVPLVQNIATYASPSRVAAFTVAPNGTLVYQPGPAGQKRQLVWYDRRGTRLATLGEPANDLTDVAVSSDGKFAVVSFRHGSNMDLWTVDTVSGIRSRLTSDPAADNFPALSRDGRALYWHGRNAETILRRSLATNDEGHTLFTQPRSLPSPAAVSPDGRSLLFFARLPGRDVDVFRLPVEADGTAGAPVLFLGGKGDQWLPVFSPDGDWVAYVSDESGRNEVYVARFPEGNGRRQISPQGGTMPRWNSNGKEIFFGAPDGSLSATSVTRRGDALEPGRTERLFANPRFAYYDAAPDGRFLIVESLAGDETAQAHLAIIQDWTSLVKR